MAYLLYEPSPHFIPLWLKEESCFLVVGFSTSNVVTACTRHVIWPTWRNFLDLPSLNQGMVSAKERGNSQIRIKTNKSYIFTLFKNLI